MWYETILILIVKHVPILSWDLYGFVNAYNEYVLL
jgi:hypothetical protein